MWRAALIQDLRSQSELTDKKPVSSIFFGGGTPSLMDPKTVGALVDEIASIWGTSDDVEITLEANPTSVEAGKFRDFKVSGVNRISMGIQALNDPDLKALGRMHTTAEAMKAFAIARECFARVSFDLIYARQHQTLKDWEGELKQALEMAVDHLSLYQLTVESGTRFGDLYKRGRLSGLPDADLGADMYDLTNDICEVFGYPSYEISNHCRAGAESRHNLIYWRYEPYLGVGPGAHGRPMKSGTRRQTVGFSNPERWLNAVNKVGSGLEVYDGVTPKEAGQEYALMSLRLREGLNTRRFHEMSGRPLNQDKIEELMEDGFLASEDHHIAATAKGRPVLNRLLQEILLVPEELQDDKVCSN